MAGDTNDGVIEVTVASNPDSNMSEPYSKRKNGVLDSEELKSLTVGNMLELILSMNEASEGVLNANKVIENTKLELDKSIKEHKTNMVLVEKLLGEFGKKFSFEGLSDQLGKAFRYESEVVDNFYEKLFSKFEAYYIKKTKVYSYVFMAIVTLLVGIILYLLHDKHEMSKAFIRIINQ